MVSQLADHFAKPVWDLVQGVERLVALPQAWTEINRLIREQGSGAEIAQAVELDTDLSVRLLRLVNSAGYRFSTPVETISRAVSLVGTRELRDLAMLTVARRLFTGIPRDLMDLETFWRRSVATGVFGSLLAHRQLVLHGERLFVMGMAHDLGLLVICQQLPDQAREILYVAGDDPELLPPAELDLLGYQHQQVGAALMSRWGLPASLVEVTAFHHDPHLAREFPLEVALIHVAGLVAGGDVLGLDTAAILARVQDGVEERFDLTPAALDDIRRRGADQIAQTARRFLEPVTSRR